MLNAAAQESSMVTEMGNHQCLCVAGKAHATYSVAIETVAAEDTCAVFRGQNGMRRIRARFEGTYMYV